jgi:hypothetical protein
MARSPRFPATLYVRPDSQGDQVIFTASVSKELLLRSGEQANIGIYRLVAAEHVEALVVRAVER